MTQSEAVLEEKLIEQLKGLLNPLGDAQDRSHVQIHDEATLLANLKVQLEIYNQTKFAGSFSK